MLSISNNRFLFVSLSVIERLHWFSVVTNVNSGLHLGCLIKQKIPVAVNSHTAQPSRISIFIWQEWCRLETCLLPSPRQETLSGPSFPWIENTTCVTHWNLPLRPSPGKNRPPFFGGPTTRLHHHHSLENLVASLPTIHC